VTVVSGKTQEADSYDAVAEDFDRLVEQFALPLAERLVALAGVAPGEQVLDVGCGTGLASRAAARRVGGGGKVLGVDIAAGALAVAETQGRRQGLVPHILRFEQMDAESLDLADGSVDVVISLYALLHLPDPAAALRAMRRVLRPGGRICIGIGSGPPLRSLPGWVHRARLARHRAVDVMGLVAEAPRQILGLLDAHLPAASRRGTEGSVDLGRRPGRALGRLLEAEGFGAIDHSWRGRVDTVADPDTFWLLQSTLCSEARYRIQAAPPEAVQRLREAVVTDAWAVLDRGGALVYPHGAWFVTARNV